MPITFCIFSYNHSITLELVVFIPDYLISRGSCCGNGCLRCPYEPLYVKGNTKLKDIYIKSKEDDKTEVTNKRSST